MRRPASRGRSAKSSAAASAASFTGSSRAGPATAASPAICSAPSTVDKPQAPDYSQPGGPVTETTIPASKASIEAIASLHALVTLDLLDDPAGYQPGFHERCS